MIIYSFSYAFNFELKYETPKLRCPLIPFKSLYEFGNHSWK